MENNLKNAKFDWADFSLLAAPLSEISSRKDVNIYNEGGDLPIMVSPMTSVVDKSNWHDFFINNFRVCMPRGNYNNSGQVFNSVSLDEFERFVVELEGGYKVDNFHLKYPKLLVDIANGSLQKLYFLTKRFIDLKTETELMIGNLSNPESFRLYAELGVHYCRLGVGGGSVCTTSANTGVHFPLASLVGECYDIKKENNYQTKIVADGGFRNFDEIIKAIACGSDFIMLGGILNKMLESCGDTTLFGIKINKYKNFFWKYKRLRPYIKKSYFGMSTKHAQKEWGKTDLKTAEGIHKSQNVEYTISQWRENFEHYLRSAMSYTNSKTLEEFKECKKVFITQNALKRFAK